MDQIDLLNEFNALDARFASFTTRARRLHNELIAEVHSLNHDLYKRDNADEIDPLKSTTKEIVQKDQKLRDEVGGPTIRREKFHAPYWKIWNADKNILFAMSYAESMKDGLIKAADELSVAETEANKLREHPVGSMPRNRKISLNDAPLVANSIRSNALSPSLITEEKKKEKMILRKQKCQYMHLKGDYRDYDFKSTVFADPSRNPVPAENIPFFDSHLLGSNNNIRQLMKQVEIGKKRKLKEKLRELTASASNSHISEESNHPPIQEDVQVPPIVTKPPPSEEKQNFEMPPSPASSHSSFLAPIDRTQSRRALISSTSISGLVRKPISEDSSETKKLKEEKPVVVIQEEKNEVIAPPAEPPMTAELDITCLEDGSAADTKQQHSTSKKQQKKKEKEAKPFKKVVKNPSFGPLAIGNSPIKGGTVTRATRDQLDGAPATINCEFPLLPDTLRTHGGKFSSDTRFPSVAQVASRGGNGGAAEVASSGDLTRAMASRGISFSRERRFPKDKTKTKDGEDGGGEGGDLLSTPGPGQYRVQRMFDHSERNPLEGFKDIDAIYEKYKDESRGLL